MDATTNELRGVVPFRFACQRCGHCCSGGTGHVWLAAGETERMAAALALPHDAFVFRYVRRVIDPASGEQRDALREDGASAERGGRCALLAGKNTCLVYAARPEHCRTFPHWPSVLTDRSAFESARATCPGIAVVVDEAVRAPAHAALARLYARAGAARADAGCCLDGAGRATRTYATALEADYAVQFVANHARTSGACKLGDGAPLACRVPAEPTPVSEALCAEVRAIERAHGYPAAYGELAELLHARGVGPGAISNEERV